MSKPQDDQEFGEGNYKASQRYRKGTEAFIEAGRVEEAAKAATPASDEEAAELEQAEKKGRERAAEEDRLLRKKTR